MTMTPTFGDRVVAAVRAKKSAVVVGIDPVLEQLPPQLGALVQENPAAVTDALVRFGVTIVTAVHDLVPAIKPNIAFFEAWGIRGLTAYAAICAQARNLGLLVIGDIKRGDISSTAAAYAQAHLEDAPVTGKQELEGFSLQRLGPHDAVTLTPYLGTDAVAPFVDRARETGKGLFLLVRTSNPSSGDLQELRLAEGGTLAERVAALVSRWGEDLVGRSGLSSVGAVVGATHPQDIGIYRRLMPRAILLLPGYGAQGAGATDVVDAFRADGSGALVTASRSIANAWKSEGSGDDWQGAARRAVERMNAELSEALHAAGKWPH